MEALFIILAMIILGIIIISIILFMLKREKNIEKNGIEVDAVVTKVTDSYDNDSRIRIYTSYVKYIGDDNNEHESKIINISTNYSYGKKLKVKFLPGKYKYCIVVLEWAD